jgi:hypothetical protein
VGPVGIPSLQGGEGVKCSIASRKTTNKTSPGDIEIAKKRMQAIMSRKDTPAGKEEKSA